MDKVTLGMECQLCHMYSCRLFVTILMSDMSLLCTVSMTTDTDGFQIARIFDIKEFCHNMNVTEDSCSVMY